MTETYGDERQELARVEQYFLARFGRPCDRMEPAPAPAPDYRD